MKGTAAELSEEVSGVSFVNDAAVGEKKSPPKSGKSGVDSDAFVDEMLPCGGAVDGGGGLVKLEGGGEVIEIQNKRSMIGSDSNLRH
jgi:hypothetical protein